MELPTRADIRIGDYLGEAEVLPGGDLIITVRNSMLGGSLFEVFLNRCPTVSPLRYRLANGQEVKARMTK